MTKTKTYADVVVGLIVFGAALYHTFWSGDNIRAILFVLLAILLELRCYN